MPTYGPNFAGTGTSTGSGHSWTGATNIYTDDGGNASVLSSGSETSQILTASNFGFSVPSDEIIVGIVVKLGDKAISFGTVVDSLIQLTSGGDNKSAGASYATTTTYGGSTDVWGLSLTYSDVNSSSFGVCHTATSTGTAFWTLDYVQMTVYTEVEEEDGPGGGGSGAGNHAYLTFRSLAIPKKATINKATITLNAGTDNGGIWAGNSTDTLNAIIRGHLIDDSDAPDSYSEATSATRTLSQKEWNEVDHWSSTHDTPDISCIIQEIVDRSGWVSGNDITIFIEYNWSPDELTELAITRKSKDYSDSPSDAAKLTLYYSLDEHGSGGARVNGSHVNQARYSPAVAGGAVCGGAADVPAMVIIGRGGCVVDGYAPIYGSQTVAIDPAGLLAGGECTVEHGIFGDGGCVVSPVAETSMIFYEVGSGGALAGGDLSTTYSETMTGGVVCDGEAPAGKFFEFTGSGGVVVAGARWLYRRQLIVSATQANIDKMYLPIAVQLGQYKATSDVEFRDSNDNKLAAEIRDFEPSTGRLWAWVKTPLRSTGTTTLYIYYGN